MRNLFYVLVSISLLSACSSVNRGVRAPNEQIVKDISDAKALYEMGEIQAAILNLSHVVEKSPHRLAQNAAYELLVEWLLEINNYAEAKRYASQFIQRHPTSPSTKKIIELFNNRAVQERLVVPPPPLKEDHHDESPSDLEVDVEDPEDQEKKKSDNKTLDSNALGILLPLSGPLAPFGKKVLHAVTLALDTTAPANLENKISEIHALGIKIFIADSAGDTAKAQTMVKNLVNNHQVALILGDIGYDTSVSAAKICQELGVALVSLSRHPLATNLGEYVFMFNPSYAQQIKFLVDYARVDQNYKRFGILYPRHNYGIIMAKAFYDAVIKSGGVVTVIEAYDAHETTFTKVVKDLAGIKCLGKRCDPASSRPRIDFEALFIPEFTKLAYLVPALVQADVLVSNSPQAQKNYAIATKIKNPMPVQLLGLSSWNDKATLLKLGNQANGAFFVDAVSFDESPELMQFKENWDKLDQGAATVTEVLAYDATKMSLKILAKNKLSREEIKTAIGTFDQQVGLLKNIKFNSQGELVTPSIGFTLEAGTSTVTKH